jgi:hypothetical protein
MKQFNPVAYAYNNIAYYWRWWLLRAGLIAS